LYVQTFVVKADPGQARFLDTDLNADVIAGFEIRAFTPEGAAMKAWDRGLVRIGLKNCVVEKDGIIVAKLYPMRFPLKMFLDAPKSYLLCQIERLRA
jgi:hypothetical protein